MNSSIPPPSIHLDNHPGRIIKKKRGGGGHITASTAESERRSSPPYFVRWSVFLLTRWRFSTRLVTQECGPPRDEDERSAVSREKGNRRRQRSRVDVDFLHKRARVNPRPCNRSTPHGALAGWRGRSPLITGALAHRWQTSPPPPPRLFGAASVDLDEK